VGGNEVNVLLDTHVWLWWVHQDQQLPDRHRELIAQAENVFVSALSCWEAVLLHQRQRIELVEPLQDWLQLALTNIVCLPLTEAIATQSAWLNFHHRDPADRFIIATPLIHDCHVMSFDGKFKLYSELNKRLIDDSF
jgi:PIN domain nuclease of toxin-antitoxin system